MLDPHKTLGINPGASEEDIKKAYKKLALEWHPDRHGGDSKAEEKFKEISAAYQILTGKIKYPHQGPIQNGFPGFTDEELFEFFRGGEAGFQFNNMPPFMHRTRAQVRLSIQVTLEEACAGGRKTIRFSKQENCHSCSGIGREVGKDVCPVCGGTGRITANTSSVFTIMVTCKACSGLGKKLGSPCGACRGMRVITTQHETTVEIPPGIGNGETIVTADGLYVTIHHIEHPIFKVVLGTLNIENEIETSLFDFLLGGEAVVTTLVGEMRVKIDSGLRPGSRLRIRGAGMLSRQGNRGDHVVRVWAVIPKLTGDHQLTLKKLRAEIEGDKIDDSTHA
jgi:molecular chaperone DnaJ